VLNPVRAVGATIGGALTLQGATLTNEGRCALSPESAQLGDVRLAPATLKGRIALGGAKITVLVEAAMWSKAGQLDWWVKDRQEWFDRVRGADGRQQWIRAVDLRPASG